MLQCGFYEREITPPIGSELPGQYELRVSTGVLDRLYAKAAVFDDGDHLVALLALDAVELPDWFCEAIRRRVEEMIGLEDKNLVICATHTHQGIPVGEAIGAHEDRGFLLQLSRLAADCVALAKKALRPCRLSFATGRVEGVSFVRDYVLENGDVRTNPVKPEMKLLRPYSENDPDLPVLFARDEEGTMLGMIYGFACHQDCVGGREFTGDYSSEVSRQVKVRFGQEVVSVYVAAACGDINHIDFMRGMARTPYRETGGKIAAEIARLADGPAEPLPQERVCAEKAYVACQYRRASREEIATAEESIRTGRKIPRAMLAGTRYAELLLQYERLRREEGKPEKELPVQALLIGGVTLFAMPGELYHAFGQKLKAGNPTGRTLVATLCNGAYGYFPTPDMFKTNVYPAQLCEGSQWAPESGDAITRQALALAQNLMKNAEK